MTKAVPIRHFLYIGLLLFIPSSFGGGLNWQSTSPLPEGRRSIALLYHHGYVYCLGGRPADESTSAIHAVNSVYYASVNADGSIGPWLSTSSLPEPRCNGGAAASAGSEARIYYWGGWSADYTTHNDCFFAPINPDGSLGSWVRSSITIPDSGSGHSQMDAFGYGIMNWGRFLYIVNGRTASEELQNSVYVSQIQTDGDFGPWSQTSATSSPSWYHGVQVYEAGAATYLYRIAGALGSTTEKDVFYVPINADGSLGSWVEATADVGTGRYEFACTQALGKLYVIGGLFLGTPQDTVLVGEINPATGNISAFTPDATLYPAARARFSAVSYEVNGSVYILAVAGGGYSASEPVSNECYYTYVGPAPLPVPPTALDSSWTLYR